MRFADFLANTPPNKREKITDLWSRIFDSLDCTLCIPKIWLHCDRPECGGIRAFACSCSPQTIKEPFLSRDIVLAYACCNCQRNKKSIALRLTAEWPELESFEPSDENCGIQSIDGFAIKYGELPAFGPPTPSRAITLIGPDRDLFIKGRQSENLGLGVGAFAYYRQVVERQKDRLLTEIAKVAKRHGATDQTLELFSRAINETQFSKAVHEIRDAIPQALLIEGRNPLILLHDALSEGIHEGTDEGCLEMATAIRTILTKLSQNISHVLKEEAELKASLKKLLDRKSAQQALPAPSVKAALAIEQTDTSLEQPIDQIALERSSI